MTGKSKVETGQTPGAVAAPRPLIDVQGAAKALTVGPREVLVMTFPAEHADDETLIDGMRKRFLEVFGPNRFLIVFADGVQMAAVDSPPDDGKGRQYVQPVLEAQAVADNPPPVAGP